MDGVYLIKSIVGLHRLAAEAAVFGAQRVYGTFSRPVNPLASDQIFHYRARNIEKSMVICH
jgi:hypothetical protein